MAGIGVILNPNSKTYKNNPAKAKRMGFIVGDKGSCKETEDLPDLRRVAEEFKSRDIDILAISGGDGTNHCSLTTFIQVYGDKPLPKIAFLRGGTLNTVAGSIGIHGTSESILSNVLVKYHEDIPFETRDVWLMKINDEYGFIFGTGLIYNFMLSYYKDGMPSPMHAAKTLVKSIGSAIFNGPLSRKMFDRFDAEVSVNGKPWSFANYSALYCGSINQLGLNFRTFYLVDQIPNQFHSIGISLPPRNLLPYLPFMYLGRPSGCPNLLEETATQMSIRLKSPLGYTIDGDMKQPVQNFDISLGPKLTVLIK